MIVITTPTGNIGSKVLRRVLQHPGLAEPVRVIARDSAKLPPDAASRVQVVQGSTDDPAVLREALQDADALFWCQPDTMTAENYLQAYDDWSHTALAAIDAAGVPQVVAISAAGDPPTGPAGPISALHRLEHIISRSRAACRFLRCGSFFTNILWQWESITQRGVFCYSMPGDVPGPHVAPDDIARVSAGLLLDRRWDGKRSLPLPGPQDLSYNEMAEELARQLGRPVRYEELDGRTFRDLSIRSGLSPSAAQGLVDMFSHLATDYSTDLRSDRSLTPTTFAQWLRETVA